MTDDLAERAVAAYGTDSHVLYVTPAEYQRLQVEVEAPEWEHRILEAGGAFVCPGAKPVVRVVVRAEPDV